MTGTDLRRMLRLTADLRDAASTADEVRIGLAGLCDLVNARVGLLLQVSKTRVPLISCVGDHGWDNEAERETFRRYLTCQREVIDPAGVAAQQFFQQTGRAARRDDLVMDRTWYRSRYVQEFRRAAQLDSCMYLLLRTDETHSLCLTLHRSWGDRAFGARELALVAAFCDEYPWMRSASPSTNPLPPRLKETLMALVDGLSEKQIAANMGLSPHTIHGYIKEIYRAYGVHNRAELCARVRNT